MKPDDRFVGLPKSFWASVRTISQQVGYTERTKGKKGQKSAPGRIKIPSLAEMAKAYDDLELDRSHLLLADEKKPTKAARMLIEYFEHRAGVLNEFVEPRLMNATSAKAAFRKLKGELSPRCPLPMNKQKGKKKARAFFTCIINMLIEANARGFECDYDPRQLTTVTFNNAPLRTLARRVDGAFTGPVNPIAVWEIKEYYYTKTFGSRVADGVYETLLDGMELQELRDSESVDVKHYLMVDDHFTWWACGRSYLCRIVDMLHMGYVDEVLFGREVIERLPAIVKDWVAMARR